MTTFLTIIYALLIFSLLIFIHEFGHFIFAKLFDIYVIEFSIGMGPAIFKKQKGETLYALRAIPMGGYCKLEGEDGESDNPRSFGKKSKFKRFVVLAAGAVMNLIFGFIVVCVMNFGYGGDVYVNTVVDNVVSGTPAYEAGIRDGDIIVGLNGNKINLNADFRIYNNKEILDITVKRGNEKLNFSVTPKSYLVDENGNIIKESNENGSVKLIGIQFGTTKRTFFNTIEYSFYESVLLGKTVFLSLKGLTTGEISPDNLSGPVGIVNEINTAAKMGLEYILYLMALITINLGIFNLLPLPALDGGRILFIIIEAIIRRPIPPKYEGIIHAVGFILLIMLMLYATGNDILRIFFK